MKRFIYTLCLILPFQASLLISQNTASELMREMNILAARNAVGGLTYEDISGSPYYSDGFINSTVYLKNGETGELPLRYDLFQDAMEFKRGGQIFWVIKNDVLSIQYGRETLIPEPMPNDPGKLTYFFVPEMGPYSLYIKKKMDFSPYVPPQGYADAVPDKFDPAPDEYYLKQEGMPLQTIKNKKALSEILSGNQAALDFIKKSKIRVNNSEDLIELVRFLNNQ